jgi:hypothetical protein
VQEGLKGNCIHKRIMVQTGVYGERRNKCMDEKGRELNQSRSVRRRACVVYVTLRKRGKKRPRVCVAYNRERKEQRREPETQKKKKALLYSSPY